MSEETPKDNIRRVSQKDQRERLGTGPLVFPSDQPEKPAPPPAVDERYPPLDPSAAPRRPQPARKPPRHPFWYNVLTGLFVLASCGVLAYYTLIVVNPYTPLNPLPPFTPAPIIVTTTPLPPTITPTPSPTRTPTPRPTLTFTPLPAELLPTRPTFTPAPFPFTSSNLGVRYERNLTAEGCEWVSIAGSVRGLQGEILNGYGVRVEGEGVSLIVYTGGADSLFFQPGEFEVLLGDTPVVAPFAVTLLSPEGQVLSEDYLVITSDRCDQNVAVIDFVQNRPVE